MSEEKKKCDWGFDIRPDGVHKLDPCRYVEIETHPNCTVHVLKCEKCGHIEITWTKNSE